MKLDTKLKKRILWVLFIIPVLFIPFLLEWLIGLRNIIPIKTKFLDTEWFTFYGSYLGTIATIALGVIALYQNSKLKKINDRLMEDQKGYFQTLASPTVSLDIKNELEGGNIFCSMPKKLSENERFENKCVLSRGNLYDEIMDFNLYVENKSVVPITSYKISLIEWKINTSIINSYSPMSDMEFKLYSNGPSLHVEFSLLESSKINRYMTDLSNGAISTMKIYINFRNQVDNVGHKIIELNLLKYARGLIIKRYSIQNM